MALNFSFETGSHVVMSMGTTTVDVVDYGNVPNTLEFTASGGRINVLPADIINPSGGRAVARDDGKTTLDFTGLYDAQTVSAETPSGQNVSINVAASAQKRGHVKGDYYYLPIGSDNRFVCEPGQRHRKWYISQSPSALTKAQIAADAGVSESAVTGAWLLTRPQYGGTPQTAISADLQPMIRGAISGHTSPSRSDWWFLERGYDYLETSTKAKIHWGGVHGEDELHPWKLGAFGTGEAPLIDMTSSFMLFPYCVIQDVRTNREKVAPKYGYSTIYDHVDLGLDLIVTYSSYVTVREMKCLYAWFSTPNQLDTWPNGTKVWTAQGANYISGIYAGYADYFLVEGGLFDHAGWGEGYSPAGDPTKPQPPTMYSHDLYFAANVFDVDVRDCFLSRASSCGTQLRGGNRIEGNWFWDNNILSNSQSVSGGGQFVNAVDNIGFGAGWKHVDYAIGDKAGGYHWSGFQTSAKGNVLAHHADPENETEKAQRPTTNNGAEVGATPIVNDTKVYKWGPYVANIAGLDTTVLDLTTAQRAAGMLMGQTRRTVQQTVDYLKSHDNVGGEVRKARKWVRSRFGFSEPERTTPANLVFRPDAQLEGFRWDNRYNWSTFDLPGTHVADTVDLAGNFVRFGTTNADIAALESNGGILDVTSGKLEIGVLTDAAEVRVSRSGQLWIGDADHALSVDMVNGRLALTGTAADLDLYAKGHAQVLLGPDCTVPVGRSLILSGPRVRVGWDGTGTAALHVAGTLDFRRGAEVTTSEFSGSMDRGRHVYKHLGEEVTGSVSGFKGRIASIERTHERGTTYRIGISDVVGQPVVGDVFDIAPARADLVDNPQTLTATGAANLGVATIQRFRSGAIGTGLVEPTVTATITLASTAQIVVPAGLPAGTYDLTGPGVTVVNQGATLPAGVSITGGKLVLTV